MHIIQIYTVIQYFLFAQFLYLVYNNIFLKRIIRISILPFTVFCLVNFFTNRNNFSNYPLLIEFLMLIIFIIYYFYEKMKTVVLYPLYQSIDFWICVGMFLYFTGNFFFLLFAGSSTDPTFVKQLKIINGVVTITKNLLLSLAFLANSKVDEVNDQFTIPSELNLDNFTLTNPNKR